MARWHIVVSPVSGRKGSVEVEADRFEVATGGYLLMKVGEEVVAAIAPGTWLSVEKA